MNLFEKTLFFWKIIGGWSDREEVFVKRTAFALIVGQRWYDKETEDAEFTILFSRMAREATGENNYVKKVVNWFLRNIGKLNLDRAAIKAAKEVQQIVSKVIRCIASNAI